MLRGHTSFEVFDPSQEAVNESVRAKTCYSNAVVSTYSMGNYYINVKVVCSIA